MKTPTMLCFALILVSSCQTPLSLAPGGTLASTLIESWRQTGTPGLQYVLVTPDQVLFSEAVGLADLESGTAMTVDTAQPIFSVSKLFTSLLILEGASRGEFALTGSIPEVAMPWPGPLTWEALLSHRSGLPDPILGGNFVYDADTTPPNRQDQLREALQGVRLASSTTGLYSNLGYALLGEAWQAQTGESWADGMARELGTLSVGPVTTRTDSLSARPHYRFSLNNWLFSSLLPALKPRDTGLHGFSTVDRPLAFYFPAHGGLVMSARTLARWLQAVALNKPDFITQELWEKWFTPQGTIQLQGDAGTAVSTLGWLQSPTNAQVFSFEGGGLGYAALVRVHRDLQVAEVLLANEGMVNWLPQVLDALDAVWQNSVTSGDAP